MENLYAIPVGLRIDTSKLRRPWFEMGPIRPPSEGKDRSLLIRATRNCAWNKCLFCATYKNAKFEYRPVDEIVEDIATARALADALRKASWHLGLAGRINNEVLGAMLRANPELYDREYSDPEDLDARIQSLVNVANWLASGGRTAFLQDADSLIMRVPELLEVIKCLKQSLPSIERVTSYARAKTASRRSLDELGSLHEAGLLRLHVGLESGAAEVLEYMKKGVTPEEHIAGAKKVVNAGIALSEYVMPGLGGRKWSEKHALESARVLNEVGPDFIRLRSLVVRRGSPLGTPWESGEFRTLGEDEIVGEIGLFIENLKCKAYLASDQMCNLLWEVEGQLPEDKQAILKAISGYLSRPPIERLKFRLERRMNSYVSVYGGLSEEVEARVQAADEALNAESPDAAEKVESAVSALKQAFI